MKCLSVNVDLSLKAGYVVCVRVTYRTDGMWTHPFSLSSVWVPFQVGSKASTIKEHPHQRAQQYGHSGKTAEVLLKPRSGEDSFLCYCAKVCVTFHRKNKERNERVDARACRISRTHSEFLHHKQNSSETVQDVILHAQFHLLSKSVIPRAYLLFPKGKRKHHLPYPPPRTISRSSGQRIGLVMRSVMTKHFRQHSTTRKPLMTSAKFPLNKVSHTVVALSLFLWMLLSQLLAVADFPNYIIFTFNHLGITTRK